MRLKHVLICFYFKLDGRSGMCNNRPNGRVQFFFQAVQVPEGNFYTRRHTCIILRRNDKRYSSKYMYILQYFYFVCFTDI